MRTSNPSRSNHVKQLSNLRLACLTSRLLHQEALVAQDQDFIANPEWDSNLVQLEAIIGGMSESVVAFDRQGKLYFANRAALELYGITQNDLREDVQKLDADFELHDLEGELLVGEAYPAARLLRGESFEDYRVWVTRKGQDRRWLASYNGTQVQDSVLLCVMSARDVTAQAELEMRHRATFDVNPTAMSIMQIDDLRFTEVNDSFLKLTGYERDEVIGKTALQLRLDFERDKRDEAIKQLKRRESDQVIEHEAVLRTKAGDYRTILSEGRVIRLDHTPLLIDTYIDISERKRAENELGQAVQMAMQDPSWFVQVVQEKLIEIRSGQAPKPGLELLSPRELEVITALAKGMSNEQIAQELSLATQTVRNYISNIYDKLGVHTRGEAIIWARERGLIFPR